MRALCVIRVTVDGLFPFSPYARRVVNVPSAVVFLYRRTECAANAAARNRIRVIVGDRRVSVGLNLPRVPPLMRLSPPSVRCSLRL
jgi:hypothetical protein